jgi:DNA polymerase-3 subunit epsilon
VKNWLHDSLSTLEIVAFDTETSGAYALGSDIVEFAAVKYKNGNIVETFQTLLKPREPMSDFIIGIHGITNEMVEDAPRMQEQVQKIRDFLGNSVLVAHHAPFDLGFLAAAFEKYKVKFPDGPILCSSLLSRKLIHGSVNHKLQTLIPFLGLKQGVAHRALDDAEACLQVTLACYRLFGEDKTLEEFMAVQEKILAWNKYKVRGESVAMDKVVEAVEDRLALDIRYLGGSQGSEIRRVGPSGIVRNPDGDYFMALCFKDKVAKRFYFSKIKEIEVVYG